MESDNLWQRHRLRGGRADGRGGAVVEGRGVEGRRMGGGGGGWGGSGWGRAHP